MAKTIQLKFGIISTTFIRGAVFCMLFSLLQFHSAFSQVTSLGAGTYTWSNPAAWVGGVVPAAGQSVVIAAGCTIQVNINTPVVNNVTVNGFLDVLNTATSTLSYNGNMVVAGTLRNNGGIAQVSSSNRTFQLSGTGTYIHNPRNLTNLDESIFEKSNEIFSVTSNLIIQKWFDINLPLGASTRVQQPIEFGNVTMNIPDPSPWEQNNQFMTTLDTPRIRGKLTVSSGIVRMDDGFALSDFMEFNDIEINGTGSIVFISGPSRPFVLITKNFTDISTSANPTVIMDNVFNLTFWTANGNVNIGHNFYGIVGSGVNTGGNLTMTVTGNFSITGGAVQLVSMAAASLTLNVSGTTTISGSPTKVRFVDGNNGNLTFNTNNFVVSGGSDNILMGGNGLIPSATGIPSININNDFTINGSPSNLTILDASSLSTGFSNQKLRLRVGHDFTLSSTNSNFTAARHRGALTVYVTNNYTHTAGRFIGQIDTANVAIDSMFVGGSFLMNTANTSDYLRLNYGQGDTYFRTVGNYTLQRSPTTAGLGFVGIYGGAGDLNFYVGNIFTLGAAGTAGRLQGIYNFKPWVETGSLTFTVATNFNMLNAGSFFRGIDNKVTDNPGTINFSVGSLNYSGGNFSGYYSSHNAGGTANFNMSGLLQITFTTAATDTFTFIGATSVGGQVSNLKLNVSVSGNFNITGPNGLFVSSLAQGRETISVLGSMNVSGGKNSFDSYPLSALTNAHPVVLNIGANLAINGGSTYLSANNDSLIGTVGGDLTVTLGELIVQGGESGAATLDVAGGFSQNGGNFYLHKNTNGSSNSIIAVTINSDNNATGNFSHIGGTITFSTNPTSPGGKILNINSPTITYGGTGVMTMANPGLNVYSGTIRYGYTGTSNFNRTTNTHLLQQIEQQVMPGCTLLLVTGNIQIAAQNAVTYNRLVVNAGAVLDLQGNQIFSNGQEANSGMTLSGRLRLTRAQGFYDGTANAALNGSNGMNFRLFTNSVVEYYGNNNQIITGVNVGLATGPAHKYSQLEINFSGTPNTEFVYPTNIPDNKSVIVRHKLILTNGELNLDNDHVPTSGGRSIVIERDSVNAITYTNGYIRSESYDSSASVVWHVKSMVGNRTIPFGFNSTNLVPFSFNLGSGDADTLIVSTYRTPAPDNLPYPPPVTHLQDLSGVNNSANTVDRFWYIRSTGTSTDANMTFTVTPSELGSIANPRAQAWIPSGPNAWQFPLQGTQLTITNGTQMNGANYYPSNWWTLSGLSTPLPVSLLDFSASCSGENTDIKWSTASELNNNFFSLMKSKDGFNYENIGTVEGAGTTSSVSLYSFKDESPNNKAVYYTLIQTDFDGQETVYGPILASPCVETKSLEVTVIHSNPDELNVIIKNPESGKFVITLYGTDGKLIASKTAELPEGLNLVNLPASGLSTGIYFVNVRSANTTTTTKVPIGFVR